MDTKATQRALEDFLSEFITSREGFLPEAKDELSYWNSEDELALVSGPVAINGSEPNLTMRVIFHCSRQLDNDSPLVAEWIAECIAAARASLPEVFAQMQAVDTICGRSSDRLER